MPGQDSFIPLESIKVAKPCRADWDKMTGSGCARFCQTCQKKVYNLSNMTRAEAEDLIRRQEGKLCVRFYQRADGTILTQDCPVGKKVARRPYYWLIASFAAFLSSGVVGAVPRNSTADDAIPIVPSCIPEREDKWASLRQVPILKTVINRVSPEPKPVPEYVMGGLAPLPDPRLTPVLPPNLEDSTTPEVPARVFEVESDPASEET